MKRWRTAPPREVQLIRRTMACGSLVIFLGLSVGSGFLLRPAFDGDLLTALVVGVFFVAPWGVIAMGIIGVRWEAGLRRNRTVAPSTHSQLKRRGSPNLRRHWVELFNRDDGRCGICGRRFTSDDPRQIQVDHIWPRSRGGTNVVHNLQLAHRTCNARKHDRRHALRHPSLPAIPAPVSTARRLGRGFRAARRTVIGR